MNKKTVYILIPGILNSPGDSSNWVGRGTTYIMTNTPHKAEKVEYFASVFGRMFCNKKRAQKLFKTLEFYKDYNIILISHSNGGDVVLDCIKYFPDFPNIKEMHFVASAGNADFEKNLLNKYIEQDKIGKCFIYVAGKDFHLKMAHTWAGKLLGYGVLGLRGGYNISNSIKNKVKTIWDSPWDNYKHSTCWSDENFEETMKLFI